MNRNTKSDQYLQNLAKIYQNWGKKWRNLIAENEFITNELMNSTTNASMNSITNESMNSMTNESMNSMTNESMNWMTNESMNSTTNELMNSTADEFNNWWLRMTKNDWKWKKKLHQSKCGIFCGIHLPYPNQK